MPEFYLELEEKLRPLADPLPRPRPGDWLAEHDEPGQTCAEYLDDPLIKNLNATGVDVHRRTCIADVELEVPAATPSMNDLAARATAALCKNPHRPSTLKKLRNLLNVKKELSEEQTFELIGALTKSGLVQIVANKVSYTLGQPASRPLEGELPAQVKSDFSPG